MVPNWRIENSDTKSPGEPQPPVSDLSQQKLFLYFFIVLKNLGISAVKSKTYKLFWNFQFFIVIKSIF